MSKWREAAVRTYNAIQKKRELEELREKLLVGALNEIQFNNNSKRVVRRKARRN